MNNPLKLEVGKRDPRPEKPLTAGDAVTMGHRPGMILAIAGERAWVSPDQGPDVLVALSDLRGVGQ